MLKKKLTLLLTCYFYLYADILIFLYIYCCGEFLKFNIESIRYDALSLFI